MLSVNRIGSLKMNNLWRILAVLMCCTSAFGMTWEEFTQILMEINDADIATREQTTTEQTTTEGAKISTSEIQKVFDKYQDQTTVVPQNLTRLDENAFDVSKVTIREDTEENVTTENPGGITEAQQGNETDGSPGDHTVEAKVMEYSGFLYLVITVSLVTFGLIFCLLVACFCVYVPSVKKQKKTELFKNPALTDVFSIIPTNGEIWKEMKHTEGKPELVLRA